LKVYFISGLGADEKVFRHIQLPPAYEVVHLPWIPPSGNESLRDYALRLAESIDTSQSFALVGLSLGGMVATEIAKSYPSHTTVIISSIPVSRSMPLLYKLAGILQLHRFIPIKMIKNLARIKRLFTTETVEDKKMLHTMIKDADPAFIRWAFHAALGWKNDEIPENFVHIHGSSDHILPLRYSKPAHIIRGAGHMMILNRSKQINALLNQIFS
jgi:pimeloyl-ACP methyl ester carboxylesterase